MMSLSQSPAKPWAMSSWDPEQHRSSCPRAGELLQQEMLHGATKSCGMPKACKAVVEVPGWSPPGERQAQEPRISCEPEGLARRWSGGRLQSKSVHPWSLEVSSPGALEQPGGGGCCDCQQLLSCSLGAQNTSSPLLRLQGNKEHPAGSPENLVSIRQQQQCHQTATKASFCFSL